jgi:hypothetical protein
VRDTLALERIAERSGDGLLAEDVIEALRPPLPGEDLIGHGELTQESSKFRVQSLVGKLRLELGILNFEL